MRVCRKHETKVEKNERIYVFFSVLLEWFKWLYTAWQRIHDDVRKSEFFIIWLGELQ